MIKRSAKPSTRGEGFGQAATLSRGCFALMRLLQLDKDERVVVADYPMLIAASTIQVR
jgi:hypothetical protein